MEPRVTEKLSKKKSTISRAREGQPRRGRENWHHYRVKFMISWIAQNGKYICEVEGRSANVSGIARGFKRIQQRCAIEDYDIDTRQCNPMHLCFDRCTGEAGDSDEQRNRDERRAYLGNNENCYDEKMPPYRAIYLTKLASFNNCSRLTSFFFFSFLLLLSFSYLRRHFRPPFRPLSSPVTHLITCICVWRRSRVLGREQNCIWCCRCPPEKRIFSRLPYLRAEFTVNATFRRLFLPLPLPGEILLSSIATRNFQSWSRRTTIVARGGENFLPLCAWISLMGAVRAIRCFSFLNSR